jgi:hypothetical protein
MSEASKFHESLDRPASQQERDFVRWLLEHSDPQYLPLASQIDALRVVSKCTCGCPTVDFALEGNPPLRKGEKVISDFGATVDDQPVGVLLFACNGSLSMLEVYSCAGSDKPFGLPKIEDIYPYIREDLPIRPGGPLIKAAVLKRGQFKEVPRADDADDRSKPSYLTQPTTSN